MCYTILMDKISTKWCKVCECFAAYESDKCCKCGYDAQLKKDESIARKEKSLYESNPHARDKEALRKSVETSTAIEGVKVDLKKAKRGRPKGSKKSK